ncbi:MAG: aspartate kinase [Deltaproteobacteria bacterium]|nr:MAG: aspartate kinase [Deltaproteobacteria bacterium]
MLLDEPSNRKRPARETERRRPVIVQKYGGSSVADIDKLGLVADRIVATKHAGHHVVAVVSAMGKSTDGLLALAKRVAAGGSQGDAATPPRRELDMLVSTGERVAMSLLSIAIQARGLKAISFTGSQCGIMTNDRHFDARIIEVRPHRIEDELVRDQVVIVAGYQGMSYRREITTLGRGGTDTTAVALAAALGAERCEIYSDVDGVYSADPRAVPDARHLPEIDYGTLQEMAESGAKVLCAQAVEWARRADIAIYARATGDPIGPTPRQTLVRKHGPSDQWCARAITCDCNVASVQLESSESLPSLLDALGHSGVVMAELHAEQRSLHALVELTNAPDWASARQAIGRLGGVTITDDVAWVSVVGDGLTDSPDQLNRFRRVLQESGCAPHTITATSLRLSATVAAARAETAQQALHAEFI